MRKITDKEVAKWYGLTYQTLGNYKRGNIEKKRMYKALKDSYSMPDFLSNDIKDLSKEELFKLHEYLVLKVQKSVDTLQVVNDFLNDKA